MSKITLNTVLPLTANGLYVGVTVKELKDAIESQPSVVNQAKYIDVATSTNYLIVLNEIRDVLIARGFVSNTKE